MGLATDVAIGRKGRRGAARPREALAANALLRLANDLRLGVAALDPLLFGRWLAGGAVIYKLTK